MFTRRRVILAVLAGLLALALSACGSGDASATAPTEDIDGPTVTLENTAFSPETLTIEAGETVTWVWNDRPDHNVVGDGFQSEIQSEGTFSHRFDEPGTYEYVCSLHPNMTGTIEVTEGCCTTRG